MTFNATDAQRLRDLAFNAGYWLLPITPGKKKPAIRGWQEKRCENLALINRAQRIGLVMGKKNLWAFDVDSKHWPKSKNAFNKMLHDHIDSEFDPDEYLHQETPSGGLHFVFKINDADWTDKTMSNQKFAKNHEGEVVLESRGAGGQILIYKEAILSKLESLKEVSSSRIYELIDWANCFDKNPEKKKQYNETVTIKSKHQSSGSDSFKEFNELYKDLPLQYLQKNGFTIVGENKIGIQVKRPGDSTSSHSGVIFHDTGGLKMFSTSTDFEAEEVYTPFDIFKIQNNIDDNHEAIMLAKEQRLIADDIDELMEGIEVAEVAIKKAKKQIKERVRMLKSFSPSEFVSVESKKPPMELIGEVIPMSGLTVLFGLTKVGKSVFAYQLMHEIALGKDIIGGTLKNESGAKKVVFYDNENPRGVIRRRYTVEDDLSTFFWKDLEGKIEIILDNTEDLEELPEKAPTSADYLNEAVEIIQEAIDNGAEVIFVDNMMRLVQGNSKEANIMGDIMLRFKALSETNRVAIILVTHTNKEYKTTKLTPYHIGGSAMTANYASSYIALNRNVSETKYWLTVPAGRFGSPIPGGKCIPYSIKSEGNNTFLEFEEMQFESDMNDEDEDGFWEGTNVRETNQFDIKKRAYQAFHGEADKNCSEVLRLLKAEFGSRAPKDSKTVNAWVCEMENSKIPNIPKNHDAPNSEQASIDLTDINKNLI